MSAMVLLCGNVFDGASEELTGPAEILIEGNRIVSIGQSVNRPRQPGAQSPRVCVGTAHARSL